MGPSKMFLLYYNGSVTINQYFKRRKFSKWSVPTPCLSSTYFALYICQRFITCKINKLYYSSRHEPFLVDAHYGLKVKGFHVYNIITETKLMNNFYVYFSK